METPTDGECDQSMQKIRYDVVTVIDKTAVSRACDTVNSKIPFHSVTTQLGGCSEGDGDRAKVSGSWLSKGVVRLK
jgi:hypothetical protein